jgi:hypothetical protein
MKLRQILSAITVPVGFLAAAAAGIAVPAGDADAEQTDVTQTPNAENEGIKKSLEQQVGAGQGDIYTPDSSAFIMARDPARAVVRGQKLFQRKFTVAQGFGPRTSDGVGNIEEDASLGAGLVDSCAGCHGRPHGAAGFGGDVFTRPDSRDAPHLFGLGVQEMIADEMTAELRATRDDAVADAAESGDAVTVELWGKTTYFGSLTAHPDGSVDTSGVEGVNADLRVRPFFAQGGTISIREFVVGAFNAEMGLESPDPLLHAAQSGPVTTPTGMVLDGTKDFIEAPPVADEFDDSDGDGVVNEIDPALIDFVEFYLTNYFVPATYQQTVETLLGRIVFEHIGCADCHTPNAVIDVDRRIANVETKFDPENGIFNRLFATASLSLTVEDDGSGYPELKTPAGNSFLVRNIFSDFKRHDLGPAFWERNFDSTLQKEFVTEPLWGVGSTAPYGHDGRSINLNEVILRHGGEAQEASDAYASLAWFKREWLLAFLESLVLFGPPDTASNLDPGDPSNSTFPQRGHGSIALPVLFNDTTDPE